MALSVKLHELHWGAALLSVPISGGNKAHFLFILSQNKRDTWRVVGRGGRENSEPIDRISQEFVMRTLNSS